MKGTDVKADTEEARKPRIRLRLSTPKNAASTEKIQVRKRKATPTPQKAENGNARKKSRRSTPKSKSPPTPGSSSSSSSDESDEEEDGMFDTDMLQSDHDKLDGTWEEVRIFSTKFGPWRLPAEIESKFKHVAKATLMAISM